MESRELRIENIVTIAHESNEPIVKIEKIEDTFILGSGKIYPINLLLGISITKEWILKFGFIIGDGKRINSLFFCKMHDGVEITMNPENGVTFICRHEVDIKLKQTYKYVHQLQNLYFALTGQELQIIKNENN